MTPTQLIKLYRNPLHAKRGRGVLAIHPYPTKIDPTAITKCILTHTQAGDTVVDCFSGSGTTGLAAMMCDGSEESTPGPRTCHLYDVGGLATFIAKQSTTRIDTSLLEREARVILNQLQLELKFLYSADDPSGNVGEIRYIIWSEVIVCPQCRLETTLYDLTVKIRPASIHNEGICPQCKHKIRIANAMRVTKRFKDSLLNKFIEQRLRIPVMVYGTTGKHFWQRRVAPSDVALINTISRMKLSSRIPIIPLGKEGAGWGEMHRAGYHTGITHIHHFYTRRSLIALSRAFELAEASDKRVRDALRLWVSSYNQAHMTLMTRVVAKQGLDDLTVTSGQSGVLYISGLPVEKNLFRGLKSKLTDLLNAFSLTNASRSKIITHQLSGHRTKLPSNSVDYVFTDPPFGDYIQYSEINRITEAWLHLKTPIRDEAIISRFAGKTVGFYQSMLEKVFREMFRILKPGRYMTLVFHSGSPEVWAAVKKAWEAAGFKFTLASILDKRQRSFKQVVSHNSVQGDALILLEKSEANERPSTDVDIWDFVSKYIKRHSDRSVSELTARYLFGRVIAHCLDNGQTIPITATRFYSELRTRHPNLNEVLVSE